MSLDQSAIRTYQTPFTLQNKNWSCRKKILRQLNGARDFFFLLFRIPGVTKREKTCFQKIREFLINL